MQKFHKLHQMCKTQVNTILQEWVKQVRVKVDVTIQIAYPGVKPNVLFLNISGVYEK